MESGLNPQNDDTDGDGRSDGQEVAEGTDPGTADAPLPADTLQVAPAALAFTADLALDTPLPQQLVQVISRNPVSWTLDTKVDWLDATRTEGDTIDATTVLAEVYKLGNGVHNGALTFSSPQLGNSVEVPVVISVTNSAAYFDLNGDRDLNVGDVQALADHIPSASGEAGYCYRRDIDRNGMVDAIDVKLMATRWESERTCCATPPAASSALMSVHAPADVPEGQDFTVEIHIDNVAQNLAGFEFELSYDPTIIRALSAELGPVLGSTARPTGNMGPAIDQDAGRIAFGRYIVG